MKKNFYQSYRSLILIALMIGSPVFAGWKPKQAAQNVSDHKKYIRAETPLDANDVHSVESIISLPRVGNMYGHTAFRVKFYSGTTLETGFVVENFDQQQNGNSSGNNPVYLEMYDTNSSQAMSRRREFKLEYAQIQFTPDEKIKFVQNLNEIIENGTGESYELYTNNCATMAMKLIKKSLINRSCGIVSNPATVISTLEKADLVTNAEANRVNGNFEYYKQNPWNGN